jgi:ppGpp synthetase/RelA/SpoT-type nucleotidyltranferase
MAEWVKREYGKGQIDRCGQRLMEWWTTPEDDMSMEEWSDNYPIVKNWRLCHALPLNVIQAGLRSRLTRLHLGKEVIVAQRLKRFSSIMNKLDRERKMKLSQMQDLGGCRAIVSEIKTVRNLQEMYCGNELLLLEENSSVKPYDYITHPKSDGYRNIVARYHPRKAERSPWDGQRIEIQLRTKLQHAFATAVETVTTFTRMPLKFGAGPTEWRRFFSLMGSALALRECTPLVENTPHTETELIAELRTAANELNVRNKLRGWSDALHKLPRKHIKDFKLLLLTLNTTKNTIGVNGFQDRKQAADALTAMEQSKRTDIDAVLVWVDSIKNLRAAYPNYYADTGEFINAFRYGACRNQMMTSTEGKLELLSNAERPNPAFSDCCSVCVTEEKDAGWQIVELPL